MRHRASARHARYHSSRPVRAILISALASAIGLAAGLVMLAGSSSAAAVKAGYVVLQDRSADLPQADQTSREGYRGAELAVLAASAARQAHASMLAALPRYTVRAGDSISAVARTRCSAPRDWTGIYAASRELGLTARDANVLTKGQHLAIQCAYDASQLKFAPAPPPPPVRQPVLTAVTSAASTGGSSYPRQSAIGGTYHGSGGMQQCIISRESGGDAGIWNASGHWGLYQFSEATWIAHGGSAASFGRANVAEQNRVYYATVAEDGYSDWAPYDGC